MADREEKVLITSIETLISKSDKISLTDVEGNDMITGQTKVAYIGEVTNAPTQKIKLQIDLFSGDSHQDINNWIDDFEYIAYINKWSDTIKLKYLPAFLTGTAKNWFRIFFINRSSFTYCELILLMREHFLQYNYKEDLRDEIRKRIQIPGEIVSKYIIDKYILCQRLDGMNNCIEQKDIIEQILDGMDSEMAKIIYIQQPKTIKELLQLSKFIEKLNRIEIIGSRDAEKGIVTDKIPNLEMKLEALIKQMIEMIRAQSLLLSDAMEIQKNQICDAIIQLSNVIYNQSRNNDDRISSFKGNNNLESCAIACFKCGESGHISKHCKNEYNDSYNNQK